MSEPHPQQAIVTDEHGTTRFRANAIVRFLLDAGPFNMNDLAVMEFSPADRSQFAQLIGYSLDGYEELHYTENFPVRGVAEPRAGEPIQITVAPNSFGTVNVDCAQCGTRTAIVIGASRAAGTS